MYYDFQNRKISPQFWIMMYEIPSLSGGSYVSPVSIVNVLAELKPLEVD